MANHVLLSRYSDKQISERLKKENRIRYDAKSISTRIQRIRVIQAERSEFELENGMKEWKIEEVRTLHGPFHVQTPTH